MPNSPERWDWNTVRDAERTAIGAEDPDNQLFGLAISGGGRVNANEYLSVAKKFGAAAVLAKPFSNQELREAVAAALGPAS